MEVDGVPAGSAPYRVLQDIEDYYRLGGMKKKLFDAMMMKEFLGRLNNAINTLVKLQLSGMTEDQILKTCRVIEENGHNLSSYSSQPMNLRL